MIGFNIITILGKLETPLFLLVWRHPYDVIIIYVRGRAGMTSISIMWQGHPDITNQVEKDVKLLV